MKALPGIKIVGFVIVVLTVAFGVYAETQHKPEPLPAPPNVIVKFGPSGPLEKLSYETALRIIKHFQKDSTLYIVQHCEDGAVKESEGTLQTCDEPMMSTSPTPTPSPAPTRSPASGPEPSPSASASGAKTQSKGAVALTIGNSREFFRMLNEGMQGEHKGKKAEKTSSEKE
jgi:hypothetical protein